MSPLAYYEVITGDLIGSRELPLAQRQQLPEILTEALNQLSSPIGDVERAGLKVTPSCLQVFRGDSFQVVFEGGGGGLAAMIYLLSFLEDHSQPAFSLVARMALGVGKGQLKILDGARAEGSLVPYGYGDGEAFVLSGELLESLKREGRRLGIATPWADVNAELHVASLFLEDLVDQWSRQQATAVMRSLRGDTQRAIAESEKVSQSAIAQRLRRAGMEAVGAMIERYERVVQDRLKAQ